MLEHDTLMAYLDQWATEKPDEIWLRDLRAKAVMTTRGPRADDNPCSSSASKHATPGH